MKIVEQSRQAIGPDAPLRFQLVAAARAAGETGPQTMEHEETGNLLTGCWGPEGPSAEDYSRCVHCGLCLNFCPTYRQTGLETESPRGRIYLIRAVDEGRLQPTEDVIDHLYLCLECRNCETACPSGVPFGRIMNAARTAVEQQKDRSLLERTLRRIVFEDLLPHPPRLELLGHALQLYQKTGLQKAVRASGVLKLFPEQLAKMELLLPELPDAFFTPAPARVYPARGERKYRVGLLTGCVMSLAFARTHEATVRVLTRNGCDVVVPGEQICCGAVHAHSGELVKAREMALRNIDAFEQAGVDFVLTNAAGCGAVLKEYPELFERANAEAGVDLDRIHHFSDRVRDITEFLADLPIAPPRGIINRRVTLQEPCHLAHAQGIRQPPRDLLRIIPGLELVEMKDPDRCCGSAGIYNIVQPEMADAVFTAKLATIEATHATLVASANPGCLMQLWQGFRRAGRSDLQAVHLVDLLDASYAVGGDYAGRG